MPSPAFRRQLTLFIPPGPAAALEAVRRVVDPVQHRLIPAHVTLCREDEIAGLGEGPLAERIASSPTRELVLRFGPAERFFEHGLRLPCIAGAERFHALRMHLLGDPAARTQEPHITLAHPRNPRAPGNDLAAAAALGAGLEVEFTEVALIEQAGTDPWRVLARARLGVAAT